MINKDQEGVKDMDIPPELCLELLMAADYLDSKISSLYFYMPWLTTTYSLISSDTRTTLLRLHELIHIPRRKSEDPRAHRLAFNRKAPRHIFWKSTSHFIHIVQSHKFRPPWYVPPAQREVSSPI